MKKLILFLLIILNYSFAFSQEFYLTVENFKNKNDPDKDFIVLEFPGKTKQELFVAAKKLVNSKIESMKSKMYTDIEGEQITFSVFGSKSKLIMLNFSGSNLYNTFIQYELNFKDGKLMIRPSFKYLTNFETNQEYITELFKRKPEKLSKATNFIDNEVNSYTQILSSELSRTINSDW